MAKITIQTSDKWKEFEYYCRWFKKTKSLKMKRKLIIKLEKILDEFIYKDLFKYSRR